LVSLGGIFENDPRTRVDLQCMIKICFLNYDIKQGERLRLHIKSMVYNFGGDCDWSSGYPMTLKLGGLFALDSRNVICGYFECYYWKIYDNDTFEIFRNDSLCYGQLKNVNLKMVQYKLARPTLSKKTKRRAIWFVAT